MTRVIPPTPQYNTPRLNILFTFIPILPSLWVALNFNLTITCLKARASLQRARINSGKHRGIRVKSWRLVSDKDFSTLFTGVALTIRPEGSKTSERDIECHSRLNQLNFIRLIPSPTSKSRDKVYISLICILFHYPFPCFFGDSGRVFLFSI